MQMVGLIACALYWFHPLAWWCLRQMRIEREQACDDWVMGSGESASDYAQQLLALARSESATTLLSSAEMARGGNLEKRIARLFQNNCNRTPLSQISLVTLLVSTILLTLGVAIIQPTSLKAEVAAIATSVQDDGSRVEAVEPYQETRVFNIAGRALTPYGHPIEGAKIYVSSQLEVHKRIAETTSDAEGYYRFSEVRLPLKIDSTNEGLPQGAFVIYGTVAGRAFAWKRQSWYVPNGRPVGFGGPKPIRYVDNIEVPIDLEFGDPQTIAGVIVDEEGAPVPNTQIEIWDVERIPEEGYTAEDFPFFDSEGLNDLQRINAPSEMWVASSNTDGHFSIENVPSGCRYRMFLRPPGSAKRCVWVSTHPGLPTDYGKYEMLDAAEDLSLVFPKNLTVEFQVVFSDSGEPAPGVAVSAGSRTETNSGVSNQDGRVAMALPPSTDFRLHLINAFGTPYVEDYRSFQLGKTAPQEPVVIRLTRAAELEVQVLNKQSGEPIKNVDLWRHTRVGGSQLPIPWVQTKHGWDVASAEMRRERLLSDENGKILTYLPPGRQTIGVGLKTHPTCLKPVKRQGHEIDCPAGVRTKVVMYMQPRD